MPGCSPVERPVGPYEFKPKSGGLDADLGVPNLTCIIPRQSNQAPQLEPGPSDASNEMGKTPLEGRPEGKGEHGPGFLIIIGPSEGPTHSPPQQSMPRLEKVDFFIVRRFFFLLFVVLGFRPPGRLATASAEEVVAA